MTNAITLSRGRLSNQWYCVAWPARCYSCKAIAQESRESETEFLIAIEACEDCAGTFRDPIPWTELFEAHDVATALRIGGGRFDAGRRGR